MLLPESRMAGSQTCDLQVVIPMPNQYTTMPLFSRTKLILVIILLFIDYFYHYQLLVMPMGLYFTAMVFSFFFLFLNA